jgi:Ca-activated chloride channel family protein
LSARPSDNAAIAQVWARAQVRALEDRYVIGAGNPAALEKQIVELSLRHGVLCRFTAFVAVDRSEVVNEGGQQQRITQPVEMPAGWAMRGAQVSELPDELQCTLGAPLSRAPWEGVILGKKRPSLPPRGAKKVMLAKQVLEELNQSGRVSKKTLLAMDEADALREPEESKVISPAYRLRARDQLEALLKHASAPSTERLHAIGVLAVQLAALLEDLKSVAAPEDVVKPLQKLHDELQKLLTQAQPMESEIARAWAECEATLTVFCGSEAAAQGRGEAFWK